MRPVSTDTGEYFVSDEGFLYSKRGGTLHKLSGPLNINGYPTATLRKDGRYGHFMIHRLVAEVFLPNPHNYTDVNHINGCKTDNRVVNLEWCTRSHNIKHAFATGLATPTRGTKSGRCKLTKEQVEYIIASPKNNRSLADELGVSNQHISRIRLKQRRYDAANSSRY